MIVRLLILLLTSLVNMQLFALDSDSEMTATLDADNIEMDFITGVRIYQGNVVFRQGSIHMTCDELTTYYDDDDKLEKAVCIGSPGTIKQRPEDNDHDVIGSALEITVEQLEERYILTGQATITQEGSTVSGSIIIYDLKSEKAVIKSGGTQHAASGSTSTEGISDDAPLTEIGSTGTARSRMVIQPRKDNKESEDKEGQ